MAGFDAGDQKTPKKGKKKKKKRVAIRIDMTPLVDIFMLLLTFFMVTTVFSKPQTMELNLPPDDTTVEVAQSSLLTLRVNKNFIIYWNKGNDPKLQKVNFEDLRKFLVEQDRSTHKMIILLKIDRDAKYNNMVDLIDEINLANLTRFSVTPLKEEDKKLMAKAG